MFNKKTAQFVRQPGTFLKLIFTVVLMLFLISLLFGCTIPEVNTQATNASTPGTTITALATAPNGPAKPQGQLVASFISFGNENFLPWKADAGASQMLCLVYDCLIYWDELNHKYLPGLAESWENSPDAMTLIYHLRKGVQFSDGWGELTAADVKYTFERQAGKDSIGQVTQTRQIASMETPDPYTLVVNFKKPQPTFFSIFSLGNMGNQQGIVNKKYIETVGDTAAAQKPIGTGPFKLVESQIGSSYILEAIENHWRVVPEFKNLTMRLIPEVSSTVAALKNKEIDLASVPAEQMANLKAAGIAAEASPAGGATISIAWGGCVIPDDSRYDPSIHNKDPWADVKVRKAMSLAIDRQAICDTIFAGAAFPAGIPLMSANMDKFQYPYDPVTARQLLKDAGYPDGFNFRVISYSLNGVPETPRLIEAMAGYWQQIGLTPEIAAIEYAAYGQTHRSTLKNAGDISVNKISSLADMMDRSPLFFGPGAMVFCFQDEGSYSIIKEGNARVNADERQAYVDKLNQYLYENYYGSVVTISLCWAWNADKVAPFPHEPGSTPYYLEYVRHAQPLNTYRLFTPWPGR